MEVAERGVGGRAPRITRRATEGPDGSMAALYDRHHHISTLVSHEEGRGGSGALVPSPSCRAVARVGVAVNLAVERFVTVGESIAEGNPEVRDEMYDACKEARAAGGAIERLCEGASEAARERGTVVRAARCLLSSVTRVLLLADVVVVKQLLLAKDRVARSLGRLEGVNNFTEFVKAFGHFGAEMVELAHLTGDRQGDLKDERRRAQMAAARQVLERSTVMLLTSSKACLRHPDCPSARENRDTVFCQMRRAMDLIHYVVKDGVLSASEGSRRPPGASSSSSSPSPSPSPLFLAPAAEHRLLLQHGRRASEEEDWEAGRTAHAALRQLEDLASTVRLTGMSGMPDSSPPRIRRSHHLCGHSDDGLPPEDDSLEERSPTPEEVVPGVGRGGDSTRERLKAALDAVVERTQDFTDSAYTSHEHREGILLLCDRARLQLNALMHEAEDSLGPHQLDAATGALLQVTADLRSLLRRATLERASDLLAGMGDPTSGSGVVAEMVAALRNVAQAGDSRRLDEVSERFAEYVDHVVEVVKLLRHVAPSDSLQVYAKHSEIGLRTYGPQVVTAAQSLARHPTSKIAKENLEVFADMWQSLMGDVAQVAQEVTVQCRNRVPEKQVYMSLPRPGKHGTTSKPLKPVHLDPEEQAKIAKAGLEMKLMSSEMDAETERWEEGGGVDASNEDNDIVKRAKNMSAMAFSMYRFTRGEGSLRTTQDLFTQAEYFAEEANRLYKVVRQFSYQVPGGSHKKDLLENLDRVPTYVQQLQFTVKEPTVGKAATFSKVDSVIHETKNLMDVISKVVTTCFLCANKYNLDFRGLSSRGGCGPSYGGAGGGDDDGSGGGGGEGGKLGTASGSDPSI
ncbi:alpha-catulin [Ischnura elegans]|uniref:alpha-catulin n=1 Tax=Ischnura elegans TaxID=197161 RepID=UPI001ED89D1A|nr:alpha-catulin [Ischnura elegans]